MKTNTEYGVAFPTRSNSRSRNFSVTAAISLFVAGTLMAASPAHTAQTSVDAAGTATVVARECDFQRIPLIPEPANNPPTGSQSEGDAVPSVQQGASRNWA